MIDTEQSKTFAEKLSAAATGDEGATTNLTLDLIPDLLQFAEANEANEPEALVQGVLVDAMRNMDQFNGTRDELLLILCRVLNRHIEAESDDETPLRHDEPWPPKSQSTTQTPDFDSSSTAEFDALPHRPKQVDRKPPLADRSTTTEEFPVTAALPVHEAKKAPRSPNNEPLSWSRRLLLLIGLAILIAPVTLIF